MNGRTQGTIVWRQQAIPDTVARCLLSFLKTAKFPALYEDGKLAKAWEGLRAAWEHLAQLTTNPPPAPPWPDLVSSDAVDRAVDVLSVYLNRPQEDRHQLHQKLGVRQAEVLSQEELEQAYSVALVRGPATTRDDVAPPPPRKKPRKAA